MDKETARKYLIDNGLALKEDFEKADSMIVAEPESDKIDEFPYVVAQLWRPSDAVTWKNLKIYTYGSQVLFGSVEDAKGFKEYVKHQKDYNGSSKDNDPENNPWKIYRIDFEEVNE